MAVEKALYTNGALPVSPDEIEIEIVNPDEVNISTDGMEMSIDFDAELPMDHGANLAEYMEDADLTTLGSELVGLYNADKERT